MSKCLSRADLRYRMTTRLILIDQHRTLSKTMTGYLTELSQARNMLDNRYDDIKTHRVQLVDSEEVFRQPRQKSQNRGDS
jgi:hypothetical protein